MQNRSAPPCAVIPVVAYPDVDAAALWLEKAFGFRVRLRVGSHRVQMWFGTACVVVAEVGPAGIWATRSSVMLRVAHAAAENVDALCDRAITQGAQLVYPPQTHVYGERQATLKDFAGHIWTLTQTVADVDPTVWGGEPVALAP